MIRPVWQTGGSVLLAVLAWQPAGAQVQSAEAGLTLAAAVEQAVNANPEVLRAREAIEEFQLRVREARAEALPQVDSSLGVSRTRDPGLRNSPFFSRIGELPPEALQPFYLNNFFYQVDVEQPIYTFGRVSAALRAASTELEGVQLDVRTAEFLVARDTALAYLDMLLAEQRRAVLESELRAREQQVQQVQVRTDLGDATRLDLLNAQVALANVRPQILAADNEIRVQRARLNETMGLPVEQPIVLAGNLALPDPLPSVPDAQQLLELAVAQRPETRRFEIDREFLDEAASVRQSDLKPEITANASVGVNTFQTENLYKFDDFHNWTVGVNVNWTLFDGYRTQAGVGQLRSQQRQSELLEQSFRAALARDLESAVGTWERAVEAVEVAAFTVTQAREAVRVAADSFQYGAATVLETLESQRAQRQSELSLLEAVHGALGALIDLKYLVGLRPDAPGALLSVPPPADPVADLAVSRTTP